MSIQQICQKCKGVCEVYSYRKQCGCSRCENYNGCGYESDRKGTYSSIKYYDAVIIRCLQCKPLKNCKECNEKLEIDDSTDRHPQCIFNKCEYCGISDKEVNGFSHWLCAKKELEKKKKLEDETLRFKDGKHKGKLYSEIFKINKQYCNWVGNFIDQTNTKNNDLHSFYKYICSRGFKLTPQKIHYNNCKYVLKKGRSKGEECPRFSIPNSILCSTHHKQMINIQLQEKDIQQE